MVILYLLAEAAFDAMVAALSWVIGEPLHRWRVRRAARKGGLTVHVRVPMVDGALSRWRPAILFRDFRGPVVELNRGKKPMLLKGVEVIDQRRADSSDAVWLRFELVLLTHSAAGSVELGFYDWPTLDKGWSSSAILGAGRDAATRPRRTVATYSGEA